MVAKTKSLLFALKTRVCVNPVLALIQAERIQIVGQSELSYLAQFKSGQKIEA